MKPFQERVVAEKAELGEKMAKLEAFIFSDSGERRDLDKAEYVRLSRQYVAMLAYAEILAERIAAFK